MNHRNDFFVVVVFGMPAFPYFRGRASDGSNYPHTGWEINRGNVRQTNLSSREIYTEYEILEKDKRYPSCK